MVHAEGDGRPAGLSKDFMKYLEMSRNRLLGATLERERVLEFAPPKLKLEFEEVCKRDVMQLLIDICNKAVEQDGHHPGTREPVVLSHDENQMNSLMAANDTLRTQLDDRKHKTASLEAELTALQGQVKRRQAQLNEQRATYLKQVLTQNTSYCPKDEDAEWDEESPPVQESDPEKDKTQYEKAIQILRENYEKEKHASDMRRREEVDKLHAVIEDLKKQHHEALEMQTHEEPDPIGAIDEGMRHCPPPVPISVPGSGIDVYVQTEGLDLSFAHSHTTVSEPGVELESESPDLNLAPVDSVLKESCATPIPTLSLRDDESDLSKAITLSSSKPETPEVEEEEEPGIEQIQINPDSDDSANTLPVCMSQMTSSSVLKSLRSHSRFSKIDATVAVSENASTQNSNISVKTNREEEDEEDEDEEDESKASNSNTSKDDTLSLVSQKSNEVNPVKGKKKIKLKGKGMVSKRGRHRTWLSRKADSRKQVVPKAKDLQKIVTVMSSVSSGDEDETSSESSSSDGVTRRVHRANKPKKTMSTMLQLQQKQKKSAMEEVKAKNEVSKLKAELRSKERILGQMLKDIGCLENEEKTPDLEERLVKYRQMQHQFSETVNSLNALKTEVCDARRTISSLRNPKAHEEEIADLKQEIVSKNRLLKGRQQELEDLQTTIATLESTLGSKLSSVNIAVVDKLKTAVNTAEMTEEMYRVSGWTLLAMGIRYGSLLSQAIEDVKLDRVSYHTAESLKKIQRGIDVLEHRFAVFMSSQRSERHRLKESSNRNWDRVLFYARSLVKSRTSCSPIIPPPVATNVFVRPFSAPSARGVPKPPEPSLPPPPLSLQDSDMLQPSLPLKQPNPLNMRPSTAPASKRASQNKEAEIETPAQRRDRILAMLYKDRRANADTRVKTRQHTLSNTIEPVFADSAKIFRLVGYRE
eukprot:TRINITY_DN24151_c0_g1_i1.p1 TRINITY_DN24151_c0_g1~~TRINITY_DN24151_c0_g1_i1.p1  ORF type:complete len:927 (+),score=238.51 TRINITY_DN24151_c0_g1_i1:33-2813(+)